MRKNSVKLMGLDLSDILLVTGSWYLPCLWPICIVTFWVAHKSQSIVYAMYLGGLSFKPKTGHQLSINGLSENL
jgi:hypothetical protein